jgi:hypothetical protein
VEINVGNDEFVAVPSRIGVDHGVQVTLYDLDVGLGNAFRGQAHHDFLQKQPSFGHILVTDVV